ncbi:CPCC family cysteine-rich protein [Rhodococcus qingshengii]|uniref:CPCC family cysteine-rich protein n=1 Tax=Rhodococcus qingshengii TaxID=334542 RepID=UPI0021B145C0|nr:CPCC family cysteine-rich protein [Rhodococcus qingshengii]MCT6735401.1 CPCC family cysteine-rich protein [Rhodococcus qingshengii]
MNVPEPRFPCPCCGHRIFRQSPDSYDICAVCFWEDDGVQLRWPYMAGGANKVSLIGGQQNYASIGVSEERLLRFVRPPTLAEPLEEGWRPIDVDLDNFESGEMPVVPWPVDKTVLYWWRPTFWRLPRG